MEKLLNLTLLLLSASCAAENITVVAVEGDTISINCSYDARQWWRDKSWCRQLGQGRCQPVASAPPAWLPLPRPSRGGTSIRDDARAGLLTVTMRGLRRHDAGLYQCQTGFLGHTRSLRRVQVEVLAGPLLTWISLFSTSWLDSWWPSSWWLCWSVLLPSAGRAGREGRAQNWVSSRSSQSLLTLDMMESASPGRALREPSQGDPWKRQIHGKGKSMEKANPWKRPPATRKGPLLSTGLEEPVTLERFPSSSSPLPLGVSSPGSYSRPHSQDHSIML
uniref:Immunoglobulin domain-containing protein n=1 Tax=Junco hyemalis TaxID=40217 RepID=A0A8C5JHF3_JUNHY